MYWTSKTKTQRITWDVIALRKKQQKQKKKKRFNKNFSNPDWILLKKIFSKRNNCLQWYLIMRTNQSSNGTYKLALKNESFK